MFDLSLQQLIYRAVAFLVVIAIHGLALAGIAVLLGDRGPKYDGRLTVNPLTHLDLLGLAGAMVFQLGWIRPIAIEAEALRLKRIGLVVCVIGSLAATLVVAWLLQELRVVAVTSLPDTAATTVVGIIRTIGQMSLWFAILNVIPFPPLTGSHVLRAISPRLGPLIDRFHYPAIAVLAVLMVTGVLQAALRPAYLALSGLLLPG